MVHAPAGGSEVTSDPGRLKARVTGLGMKG